MLFCEDLIALPLMFGLLFFGLKRDLEHSESYPIHLNIKSIYGNICELENNL